MKFIPIQSDDNLHIFSLDGTTTSTNLVNLHKICFPEFNHNMVVNEHPTLFVDSKVSITTSSLGLTSLISVDFNLIMITILSNRWNTIFHFVALLNFFYYSSLFTPIDVDFEDNSLGKAYSESFATHILDAKYEQVNIHDFAFNQQQHLLDQC